MRNPNGRDPDTSQSEHRATETIVENLIDTHDVALIQREPDDGPSHIVAELARAISTGTPYSYFETCIRPVHIIAPGRVAGRFSAREVPNQWAEAEGQLTESTNAEFHLHPPDQSLEYTITKLATSGDDEAKPVVIVDELEVFTEPITPENRLHVLTEKIEQMQLLARDLGIAIIVAIGRTDEYSAYESVSLSTYDEVAEHFGGFRIWSLHPDGFERTTFLMCQPKSEWEPMRLGILIDLEFGPDEMDHPLARLSNLLRAEMNNYWFAPVAMASLALL